jgi:hypothetical protein
MCLQKYSFSFLKFHRLGRLSYYISELITENMNQFRKEVGGNPWKGDRTIAKLNRETRIYVHASSGIRTHE